MAARVSKAFSPAGISSFFQICDHTPDGKPIKDLERVGARGGGFALAKGVTTEVNVAKSRQSQVAVFINGKLAPEAETTRTVASSMLENIDSSYSVIVRHKVDVPIGAGFGASGAGAIGTALALSDALDVNFTYNQIARVAHVAEVKCQTGLGTVSGLIVGGCVIVLKPGAPNHGLVDRIPISQGYHIVAGVFKKRLTRSFLSEPRQKTINMWGEKTINRILAHPSLRNFLQASKNFAIETGLATARVRKLIDKAEKVGAVGAAQNMLGEAVHALVEEEKIEKVVRVFEEFLPRNKVIVSQVYLSGAQLLSGRIAK